MREEHTIVTGIHHCTICVGAAQEDIDFMTKVIGQRLIKQTVLFDGTAPIYHLYYANKNAEIGTVMTTFPFKQAGVFGRRGTGQIAATAYSVSEDAIETFWPGHLERHGVKHSRHPEAIRPDATSASRNPRATSTSSSATTATSAPAGPPTRFRRPTR